MTQHTDDLAMLDDTTCIPLCPIPHHLAPSALNCNSRYRSLATAHSHKQTKKVVLRLECTVCKVKHQLVLKRTKHFELGGDKKQVSNLGPRIRSPLNFLARCRHLFLSSLYGLEMELGLEAGIDGPGILGMYWYETVLALGAGCATIDVHCTDYCFMWRCVRTEKE
jgi:hypothetical protein